MKTVSKKLLSILLVAILLVSAIPFQAFAECSHDNWSEYRHNDNRHWQECLEAGCDEKQNVGAHNFGSNSICTVCGYACTHPSYSNGACTNCGAADPSFIAHTDAHPYSWLPDGANQHKMVCTFEGCSRNGLTITTAAHDWSRRDGICHQCNYSCVHSYGTDNVCDICGMSCPNHNPVEIPGTAVNPSCTGTGKYADKSCSTCGLVQTGATIPATGHNYENYRCTKCGATQPVNIVVLYPNGGTIGGSAAAYAYTVEDGGYLVNLPQPDTREDYTFVGWRTNNGNGSLIYPNSTANVTYDKATMGNVFIAEWVAKTKHVEIYAVLNSNYSSPLSGYVWQGEAPENGNLLDYLKTETVRTAVNNAVASNPGYSWDGIYRDRLGNPLSDGTANQAQNVYVNFASVPYTLYFDADGGTVAPTSKTVYKGSKVGTLPTPVKNGMVFLGWRDTTDNTLYTADTIYNKAGDGMVKAVWKEEAKVYLRVYLNKNFDTPDRLLEVNSYVVDDHISWSAIDTMLRRYYTPAAGSTMVVNGLFDVNTWGGYRANPNQERKSDIRVAANSGTEIYVMITGVASGSTVVPTTPTSPVNPTVPANGFWVRDLNGNLTWYPAGSSLPSGTGYWVLDANGNPNIWVMTGSSIIPTYIYVGSNPKTGDTAKIEIAAAVMVLAAAALVTVMALRKKKSV